MRGHCNNQRLYGIYNNQLGYRYIKTKFKGPALFFFVTFVRKRKGPNKFSGTAAIAVPFASPQRVLEGGIVGAHAALSQYSGIRARRGRLSSADFQRAATLLQGREDKESNSKFTVGEFK